MASSEPASKPRTGRRRWAVATVVLGVALALVVGVVVGTTGTHSGSDVVTVTDDQCGGDSQVAHPGRQIFSVVNASHHADEVMLADASGGTVAEIAVIGPGTTVDMPADLANGTYTFNCFSDLGVMASAPVRVTGATSGSPTPALQMVTVDTLVGPNDDYETYAAQQLATLGAAVTTIQQDLMADNLTAARSDWLSAELDWERVGASYDSFGAEGEAVDGLPDGLPGGVDDPNFIGLHRLEYGLWHGQSASTLLPITKTLSADIATLQGNLDSTLIAGDPTNLPTRAHEILEDSLRDHLSGIDDLGAGAAYAETAADLQATRVILGELAPLIAPRAPTLVATADAQMDALQSALSATQDNGQWQPAQQVSQAAHEQVNAALGALLETLAPVPDLLQVPGIAASGGGDS